MQTHANQTNQPSGASAGAVTQLLTKADLDLSRLDRTVDRYQLLLLAKRVGKLGGFTPRMLQLLEYYMAYTTAKDWEEGSRPVVFQSLARTAMDLGVGERQIQKLEKRLFDIGAICWNDSGNHKRYGRRCSKSGRLLFAYGVDLTPLAYLAEAMQVKLYEKQLYAETWRETKREISETRRQIRDGIQYLCEEGTESATLADLEVQYRKISYELRSHIDLTRLRELLQNHIDLSSKVRRLAEAIAIHQSRQSKLPAVSRFTRKRSCSHGIKVTHQEHNTPIEKKRRTQEREKLKVAAGPQLGNREKSTREALRFAIPLFRAHVQGTAGTISWNDIINAAYHRRSALGISKQTWADACNAVGRVRASIGLVRTDRRSCCSEKPLRNPQAYFRTIVGDSV